MTVIKHFWDNSIFGDAKDTLEVLKSIRKIWLPKPRDLMWKSYLYSSCGF